jgi:putative hydrolase of the HAD superfamily
MKPIRVITFDADDTLWDFRAMMGRGIEAASALIRSRLGEAFAYMTPEYLAEWQHRQFALEDPQTMNYLEVRRKAWGQMLQAAGVSPNGLLDEVVQVYVTTRDQAYAIYPDAVSTLQSLRGRYILGYLTNGTTKPEKVGMAHLFDFAITPETLGMRKPRPEIFWHAAKLGNAQIDQVLHIGDDLESDVEGALKAGCQAIWFNPYHDENPNGIRPTAEIHALGEVLGWLAW